MKKRAVFLDRDGVLNQVLIINGKPYPPQSLEELIILPNVFEALKILKDKGFLLIVVTNQPDVSRGLKSKLEVDEINHYILNSLPLDDLRTCFHDDKDNCHCRKPLPGLLLDAAREYNIDLENSYMVGDRWRDIEAGKATGCKTIWLDYQYAEKKPSEYNKKFKSLYEASLYID